MSNIQIFKKAFTNMCRGNNFRAVFSPPSGVGPLANIVGGAKLATLSLLCYSAPIPNVSLTERREDINGILRKKGGRLDFDTAPFSFYVDSKMLAPRIFDAWIRKSYDPKTGITNYPDEYLSDTYVFFGTNDNLIPFQGIVLYDSYPTLCSEIPFSYENENQVARYTVNMNYRYWEYIV